MAAVSLGRRLLAALLGLHMEAGGPPRESIEALYMRSRYSYTRSIPMVSFYRISNEGSYHLVVVECSDDLIVH